MLILIFKNSYDIDKYFFVMDTTKKFKVKQFLFCSKYSSLILASMRMADQCVFVSTFLFFFGTVEFIVSQLGGGGVV